MWERCRTCGNALRVEGRGPLPAGLEPYSCTETRGNGASQQGRCVILVNAVWRSLGSGHAAAIYGSLISYTFLFPVLGRGS